MVRKIIHIDMDAFFASVEQRDHPEYKGKPLVVGSPKPRGVISAASYEARKYGVYSAMSSSLAQRKCPKLIFAPHRLETYKAVSRQIMAIFREYTDLVEPLSLDEAFLDVTTAKKGPPSATLIAKEIKERIYNDTRLTASAGISSNKFLAKIASDQQKPNGLFLIKPQEAQAFINQLKIEKFFGVGAKTAEKMHRLGIFHGKDLKQWSLNGLIKNFGKAGNFFYNIARAIDNRPVVPSRTRKSVGIEDTFQKDILGTEQIKEKIDLLLDGLWKRILKHGKFGRTLTLKIKFFDFEQITRSKTVLNDLNSQKEIKEITYALLDAQQLSKAVRLLGVSISNFEDQKAGTPIQLKIKFE